MKHHLKTVALILAISVLLLCLSSCRGWSFIDSLAAEIFHNSRWESKDGKLVLYINTGKPTGFGYIMNDGEKLPFFFDSSTEGFGLRSAYYFDGENIYFDWDCTLAKEKRTFILGGYTRHYSDRSTKVKLIFYTDSYAVYDHPSAVGLPAKITLYLKAQDIPAEDIETESGELLYWRLGFSASGSLEFLTLIAPADISAGAITVDKSGSYRMPPLPSPS